MTKRIVKLGPVTLGKQTRIAVPLVGASEQAILNQLPSILAAKPDLIEWRIDDYPDWNNPTRVSELGQKIQHHLGKVPLLVTFRTILEGGKGPFKSDNYQNLILFLNKQAWVAAIDVEWKQTPDSFVKKLQKPVILSQHNFTATPNLESLSIDLKKMGTTNADIIKLAVMPKTALDVANLLQATIIANQTLSQPLVTMSMGNLGKISRISGNVFGSAITFATAGASSAPGQLPVNQVRQLLNEFKI